MTQKKDNNNNLEQFIEVLKQDFELQEKLKLSVDRETYARLIVELGAERGYKFSKEEVEATLNLAAEANQDNDAVTDRLSEQELQLVAGGRGAFRGLNGASDPWQTVFAIYCRTSVCDSIQAPHMCNDTIYCWQPPN